MQSEPSRSSKDDHQESTVSSNNTHLHHGFPLNIHLPIPSTLPSGGNVGGSESRSEWTPSPSLSGISSPEVHDAWLSPNNLVGNSSAVDLTSTSRPQSICFSEFVGTSESLVGNCDDCAPKLFDLPEETLFQIVAYLPPSDLLKLKLIARRFYALITSPRAWINAFMTFFPGSDVLRDVADTQGVRPQHLKRTKRRLFTRLSSSYSWNVEFMIRTRLLRCLIRGSPSLPFISPSPRQPRKGGAILTYSSRLTFGCSHLDANFGLLSDLRKPQFVHGTVSSGSVTSSDARGKLSAWGYTDRMVFRHFTESHPGSAFYGLGSEGVVGGPNVMAVSQQYGLAYGECTPSGQVYYLAPDERHGRYLAPFHPLPSTTLGIPRILQARQSICSVWLAKYSAIPSVTKGLVGILAGTSDGVVSAFSLGASGSRYGSLARGQLTVRWLLSPGVPIVALLADDTATEERVRRHRVWVVALNALGEVFYLSEIPQQITTGAYRTPLEAELQAWQVGRRNPWTLVQNSKRLSRHIKSTGHIPADTNTIHARSRSIEHWLELSPIEVRSEYIFWDMRRRLDFDFGGGGHDHMAEVAIITTCAFEDSSAPSIVRYCRPATTDMGEPHSSEPTLRSLDAPLDTNTLASTSSIFEMGWHISKFDFNLINVNAIKTTAIDMSSLAKTTSWEDDTAHEKDSSRSRSTEFVRHSDSLPGQRARLFAAGTSTGSIFVWNARAPASTHASYVSLISPVRVIHTESLSITSLAVTALCLVHGGEEGLVQAWDVLASTLQPLRTLSSRHAINRRRRAVLNAQQSQAGVASLASAPHPFAASAICLDSDPTLLRGIAAIGGYLRYWSYSSALPEDDMNNNQKRRYKRRINKGNDAGRTVGSLHTTSASRRTNIKDLISHEKYQRVLDDVEHREEVKEYRRLAGRFGVDLLGQNASEEELVAYAKLLSQEDDRREGYEPEMIQPVKSGTSADSTNTDKMGFGNNSGKPITKPASPVPRRRRCEGLAMDGDDNPVSRSSLLPGSRIPYDADPDLAEAIALSVSMSLNEGPQTACSSLPQLAHPRPTPSRLRDQYMQHGEDAGDEDFAHAIELSLGHTPRTDWLGNEDKFSELGAPASFSIEAEQCRSTLPEAGGRELS